MKMTKRPKVRMCGDSVPSRAGFPPSGRLDLQVPDSPHVSKRDGLGPASDVELLQDVLDVRADRPRADHESPCDLRLLEAPGHELEHLALSRGQLGERRFPAGPVTALGLLRSSLRTRARSSSGSNGFVM